MHDLLLSTTSPNNSLHSSHHAIPASAYLCIFIKYNRTDPPNINDFVVDYNLAPTTETLVSKTFHNTRTEKVYSVIPLVCSISDWGGFGVATWRNMLIYDESVQVLDVEAFSRVTTDITPCTIFQSISREAPFEGESERSEISDGLSSQNSSDRFNNELEAEPHTKERKSSLNFIPLPINPEESEMSGNTDDSKTRPVSRILTSARPLRDNGDVQNVICILCTYLCIGK